MRFIFLGTGTSSGIPAIACDCAVCTSDDPRDQRLRTGAAVCWVDSRGEQRVVLIDATPDLRQQALRAGLTRCDAIVFTHNHVDHTFGLDEIRRFNAVMGKPIELYANEHTLDHLRRVYKHIFEAESNVNRSFVATVIAHRIDAGEAIDLYGVRFAAIPLLHGRLPVLGWRIEPIAEPRTGAVAAQADGEARHDTRAGTAPADASEEDSERAGPWWPLAYCTDVSAIPPEGWAYFTGVRTLVLDALRHRRHPTHFTLGQAAGIAERVGAERTWFVHMAHELPHAQTDASLPDGMALAYDGLVLESDAGAPRISRCGGR